MTLPEEHKSVLLKEFLSFSKLSSFTIPAGNRPESDEINPTEKSGENHENRHESDGGTPSEEQGENSENHHEGDGLNSAEKHGEHHAANKVNTLKLWDGTLGLGGHLRAWLGENKNGFAYGSDADAEMLEKAKSLLEEEKNTLDRYTLKHSNFAQNPFEDQGLFDLIFLDLGISSLHFETLQRGFSFREDEPLDMRLDPSVGIPVSIWLNKASFGQIVEVIKKYGEDRFAPKIAGAIIKERENREVLTTWQLKDIVESAYPAAVKFRGTSHSQKNPSVKTFQAFRIYINKELENLEKSLEFLPGLLAPGGRLIIISFHSLEDRIVKHKFIDLSREKDESPLAKSYYKPGL